MKKTLIVLLAVSALFASALTGCGSSTAEQAAPQTTTAEVKTDASAAPGDAAGFSEIPIFEDEQVGFLNVSAVYFQPVPMSGGYEDVSPYNLHLEADIHALENDLGYGVGDWVPYLTVDYTVTGSDGKTAAEGTFMEMNASDGPHYGANVALPNADTYSLTITIHSPEDQNYLIHTDAATGPGGTFDEFFADGALTYTFEGWDYTPQEW